MTLCFSDENSFEELSEQGSEGENEMPEEEAEILNDRCQEGDYFETNNEEYDDEENTEDDDRDHITLDINGREYILDKMEESLL